MEPTPKDLAVIAAEEIEVVQPVAQTPAFNDPLEDLFTEALLSHKIRARKQADPSVRNALDAASKKMKELYTLPENWTRKRGIALIHKGTNTLIGNFSEYIHASVPNTRKLLRERTLISIDATEIVDGCIGDQVTERLKGTSSWEATHEMTLDLWMDELMVGCPRVKLNVKTKLGVVVRADLAADTQFASASGAAILQFPEGVNIWEALSSDSKAGIRRQL